MLENKWNTDLYEDKHTFVWQYGEDLLKLLSPQPGERILDLGCGTGQLTEKIALCGSVVTGIDADPSMIEKAKHNYPHLQFAVADASNFQVEQPFDAVFSNAVLHWIPKPDAVIQCIYQAMKPRSRFVAEFGGKGNVHEITIALYGVLAEMGYTSPEMPIPWYFPSISEYTTRLEQHGFEVTFAVLFDRPSRLSDGDAGMANWIRMFGSRFLSGLSAEQQTHLILAVEQRLKPVLYHDGTWIADNRRIRIVAMKSS
ncbi:MAG: methyltransferase domain-containing protein [Rhizonema sp. PD37]|nr:methyltransferase domain-containing protein [Rhizonema sp. PD37]